MMRVIAFWVFALLLELAASLPSNGDDLANYKDFSKSWLYGNSQPDYNQQSLSQGTVAQNSLEWQNMQNSAYQYNKGKQLNLRSNQNALVNSEIQSYPHQGLQRPGPQVYNQGSSTQEAQQWQNLGAINKVNEYPALSAFQTQNSFSNNQGNELQTYQRLQQESHQNSAVFNTEDYKQQQQQHKHQQQQQQQQSTSQLYDQGSTTQESQQWQSLGVINQVKEYPALNAFHTPNSFSNNQGNEMQAYQQQQQQQSSSQKQQQQQWQSLGRAKQVYSVPNLYPAQNSYPTNQGNKVQTHQLQQSYQNLASQNYEASQEEKQEQVYSSNQGNYQTVSTDNQNVAQSLARALAGYDMSKARTIVINGKNNPAAVHIIRDGNFVAPTTSTTSSSSVATTNSQAPAQGSAPAPIYQAPIAPVTPVVTVLPTPIPAPVASPAPTAASPHTTAPLVPAPIPSQAPLPSPTVQPVTPVASTDIATPNNFISVAINSITHITDEVAQAAVTASTAALAAPSSVPGTSIIAASIASTVSTAVANFAESTVNIIINLTNVLTQAIAGAATALPNTVAVSVSNTLSGGVTDIVNAVTHITDTVTQQSISLPTAPCVLTAETVDIKATAVTAANAGANIANTAINFVINLANIATRELSQFVTIATKSADANDGIIAIKNVYIENSNDVRPSIINLVTQITETAIQAITSSITESAPGTSLDILSCTAAIANTATTVAETAVNAIPGLTNYAVQTLTTTVSATAPGAPSIAASNSASFAANIIVTSSLNAVTIITETAAQEATKSVETVSNKPEVAQAAEASKEVTAIGQTALNAIIDLTKTAGYVASQSATVGTTLDAASGDVSADVAAPAIVATNATQQIIYEALQALSNINTVFANSIPVIASGLISTDVQTSVVTANNATTSVATGVVDILILFLYQVINIVSDTAKIVTIPYPVPIQTPDTCSMAATGLTSSVANSAISCVNRITAAVSNAVATSSPVTPAVSPATVVPPTPADPATLVTAVTNAITGVASYGTNALIIIENNSRNKLAKLLEEPGCTAVASPTYSLASSVVVPDATSNDAYTPDEQSAAPEYTPDTQTDSDCD